MALLFGFHDASQPLFRFVSFVFSSPPPPSFFLFWRGALSCQRDSAGRCAFSVQSSHGYVSKGQLLWMLSDSGMPVNKADLSFFKRGEWNALDLSSVGFGNSLLQFSQVIFRRPLFGALGGFGFRICTHALTSGKPPLRSTSKPDHQVGRRGAFFRASGSSLSFPGVHVDLTTKGWQGMQPNRNQNVSSGGVYKAAVVVGQKLGNHGNPKLKRW